MNIVNIINDINIVNVVCNNSKGDYKVEEVEINDKILVIRK